MHTIGIDFGTTKTLVSRIKAKTGEAETVRLGQGKDHISTSVFIANNGEMCFGDDADDRISDPDGTYLRGFKMHLGRSTPELSIADEEGELISYTAADIITHYLRYIRQRVQETVFAGQPVTHVTITRPVNFTAAPCDELLKAALNAGFEHVELTTEPEAAGLAFCRLNDAEAFRHSALIVDWGGGTLDFALVTRENDRIVTHPHLTDGDMTLGGDLFDQQLWEFAKNELLKQGISELDHITAMPIVRKNKEKLSSMATATMRFPHGQGTCPPISLTRDFFNQLIEKHVEKAADKIMRLLEKVPQEDKPEALLLVGGSCNIPLIKTKLEEICNLPAKSWHFSREAVALGAALWEENVTIIPVPVIPNEEQPTLIDSPIEEEKTEEEPAPITPMEDVAPLIAPDIPEEKSVEWPVSDISEETEEEKESTPVEELVSEPAQPPAPQKRSRLLPLTLLLAAAAVPAYFYLAPLYTEEMQATAEMTHQQESQINEPDTQPDTLPPTPKSDIEKVVEEWSPIVQNIKEQFEALTEVKLSELSGEKLEELHKLADKLGEAQATTENIRQQGFDNQSLIDLTNEITIAKAHVDNFLTRRIIALELRAKIDTINSGLDKSKKDLSIINSDSCTIEQLDKYDSPPSRYWGEWAKELEEASEKYKDYPEAKTLSTKLAEFKEVIASLDTAVQDAYKRLMPPLMMEKLTSAITKALQAQDALNSLSCNPKQFPQYEEELRSWKDCAETVEQKISVQQYLQSSEITAKLNELKTTIASVEAALQKAKASDYVIYKVCSGDTASRIAKKHGITYYQLNAYNGCKNDIRLHVGATIKIPVTPNALKVADLRGGILSIISEAQAAPESINSSTCTQQQLDDYKNKLQTWRNTETETRKKAAELQSPTEVTEDINKLAAALSDVDTAIKNTESRIKREAEAATREAEARQSASDEASLIAIAHANARNLLSKLQNNTCTEEELNSIPAQQEAWQKKLSSANDTVQQVATIINSCTELDSLRSENETFSDTLDSISTVLSMAINRLKETKLLAAVGNGNAQETRALLEQGIRSDLTDSEGNTLLHLAAKSGNKECLHVIQNTGGSINATNNAAKKPYDVAVGDCRKALAQAELTAMGISAKQYSEKLVSHISPKDKNGRDKRPRSNEEVARTLNLLLDAGANINYQRASDKTTPLIMAVCHSKVCLTELLKRPDLKIDLQDSEGLSALSFAAHFGETEMLTLLLQAGAKTSVVDKNGHTPLTLAVKNNKKDCVRELLNYGADINYKRRSDGITPLMFAACYSDDCLRELLKHHSISENLNLTDHEKRTALHYAAAEASKERVKMLLEAGASVTIKDSSGNTPREFIGVLATSKPTQAVINEIKALLDSHKKRNSR